MNVTILTADKQGKVTLPAIKPGAVIALVETDATDAKQVNGVVQVPAKRGGRVVTHASVEQAIPADEKKPDAAPVVSKAE